MRMKMKMVVAAAVVAVFAAEGVVAAEGSPQFPIIRYYDGSFGDSQGIEDMINREIQERREMAYRFYGGHPEEKIRELVQQFREDPCRLADELRVLADDQNLVWTYRGVANWHIYNAGTKCDPSPSRAQRWFKHLEAAARDGEPQALSMLGQRYYKEAPVLGFAMMAAAVAMAEASERVMTANQIRKTMVESRITVPEEKTELAVRISEELVAAFGSDRFFEVVSKYRKIGR